MVVLYILRFHINTLLCYIVVSVLVLDIGIARGQYYWMLDIGCISWYCSNPNYRTGTGVCCCIRVQQTLHVHSPGCSTLLREMTSWLTS